MRIVVDLDAVELQQGAEEILHARRMGAPDDSSGDPVPSPIHAIRDPPDAFRKLRGDVREVNPESRFPRAPGLLEGDLPGQGDFDREADRVADMPNDETLVIHARLPSDAEGMFREEPRLRARR